MYRNNTKNLDSFDIIEPLEIESGTPEFAPFAKYNQHSENKNTFTHICDLFSMNNESRFAQ